MSLVRVRNADTGAEAVVPETALPILRASNWDVMPDGEAEAADRAAAELATADALAMTQAGLAAIPSGNAPTTGEAE